MNVELCLSQGAVLLATLGRKGPDLTGPLTGDPGERVLARFEGVLDRSPARIRAAAAVLAAAETVTSLIAESGGSPRRAFVILDDASEVTVVAGDGSRRSVLPDRFAARIAAAADVDPTVGDRLWRAIARLVRKDALSLPGLASASALAVE